MGVPPHFSHITLLPPNCPEGRPTVGRKQDLTPWTTAKSSVAIEDHWAHWLDTHTGTFQECWWHSTPRAPIITGKPHLLSCINYTSIT